MKNVLKTFTAIIAFAALVQTAYSFQNYWWEKNNSSEWQMDTRFDLAELLSRSNENMTPEEREELILRLKEVIQSHDLEEELEDSIGR